MTLFADVVTASKLVSETSSRSRKIAILAELLRELEASEVPIAVASLSGVPRQGRVGIGYSTVHGLKGGPAAEASLSVGDVDRAITDIKTATGSGSASKRRRLLAELVAAPGEGGALAAFLASARETAAREEGTVTWHAFKLSAMTYGIFDTLASEDGRNAHLAGGIPVALARR